MRHIIYIPGLNDQSPRNKFFVQFIPRIWDRYEVTTHVFEPYWSEDKTFQPMLRKIETLIDSLAKDNNSVSLVGQSAGGAAALNAYAVRKSKVDKVISINGRLRKGDKVFPSLDLTAIGNPAFKDSVLLFEKVTEKKLTKEDRKRIMVIHPAWDDIVPVSTTKLEGALDVTMPIITHMLGGLVACTIYSKKMMEFLKQTS